MRASSKSARFQRLPSTDQLLQNPELRLFVEREGQPAVADAIRRVLARLREEIADDRLDEKSLELALDGLPGAVERQLRQSLRYSLRPVINATGVILHTNLGRAPLAAAVVEHIRETALSYCNLELDLGTGGRGKRDVHVDRLFQKLFEEIAAAGDFRGQDEDSSETGIGEATDRGPALSTIVVNNNAAAVLLALNSLAEGGEVVVSRGELVEIGGSFRVPEVMSKSQATLREVGTTNRTRIEDYESAITERTRLLLRVHRSNFAITGFTEQPALAELVALARRRKIPLIEDLGSGALFDLRSVGINNEPSVADSLRAGVDLVTYSGDKLMGGPQAGLITGRRHLVARLRSNSLFRALRVDKLTYAALEATVLAYVKGDHDAMPALRMMRLTKSEIARRAEGLVAQIATQQAREPGQRSGPSGFARLKIELLDGESVIGGGAAPSAVLPTLLIAVTHRDFSAEEFCARLRQCDPPLIARVEADRVLLDVRTVLAGQDPAVVEILGSIH